jgi:hypothetical protein
LDKPVRLGFHRTRHSSEFPMPTTAADHRHVAGRFHARVTAPPLQPRDATGIRRVETPAQALAAVLFAVGNAAATPGMPVTTVPVPERSVAPPATSNCIPVPLSPGLPGVLHGVAGLLRSPVTELFTDARNTWERHEGVRCAPPITTGLRALLRMGDMASTLAETALVGPRGTFALQAVGSLLDLGADAMEHRPLDRDTVMDAVMAGAGLRAEEPGALADAEVDGAHPMAALSPELAHPVAPRRERSGPRLAIAQTTAELHAGAVTIHFEGAAHPLVISDGQLRIRADSGDVPVRWDTADWQWKRTPVVAKASASTRPDSSIRLFDRTADEVHRQAALADARLRLDLLRADGILYYEDPSSGQVGNAVCVDGRYYPVTLEAPLDLRIGTLELTLRDGIYQQRQTRLEHAAEDMAPPRCRRAAGQACVMEPDFSPALSSLLESHQSRALTVEQAGRRGIVADPERPGWHYSRQGGHLRHYVRFNDRYFRVRTRELDRFTQRLSLYLPRATGAGRMSERGQLAHRIADIHQSLPANEHRFMTQAEFNVEYRGMPSLEAAQVYESAIQQTGRLRLSQLQRAAIRSYLTWRRRSVDDFLHFGNLQPVFRDSDQVVAHINRGLARIPPHAGRVYAALPIDAGQLRDLQVGQSVYTRSFLVASGDRRRAVDGAVTADTGPRGAHVVLTLAMHHHAHPTGLISLQEEAQVLIGNNVLFKVVAKTPGELHLEELGPARQAMGILGAQPLRSLPAHD